MGGQKKHNCAKAGVTFCPDPTIITSPKTFHNQSISSLQGLKDSCHSRREPGVPLAPTSEIILPEMPLEAMELPTINLPTFEEANTKKSEPSLRKQLAIIITRNSLGPNIRRRGPSKLLRRDWARGARGKGYKGGANPAPIPAITLSKP